jgi:hypothetical protein
MNIVIRLSEPKTDGERLFKIEASVDDLKNPGEATINIDGKEYAIELHFDPPRRNQQE